MMAMMKAVAQQQGSSPFNDDYRDACITSGAVGLWMLDETTGTTAVDQGTAGVDGTYYGQLATSASRGVRSAFNIPLAGCSATDSGTSGNGFRNGVVSVASNSAFATELQVPGGAMSWEWVGIVDHAPAVTYSYWLKHYSSGFGANIGPMAYVRETATGSFTNWQWQKSTGGNYGIAHPALADQAIGVATHNVITFSTNSSQDYLRWYRNGVRVVNYYKVNMVQINGVASPIYIGGLGTNSSYWPTYGLPGAMGGVAMYDYALSQTDVTTHYNALLT